MLAVSSGAATASCLCVRIRSVSSRRFVVTTRSIDGYDQEPWRFGKYYEDIIRKYLKLRYALLPYLYTTLEEAHRFGRSALSPADAQLPGGFEHLQY